jgi:hypothetical protein
MLWRMGDENNKIIPRDYVVESIKAEIEIATPSRRQRIFEAIALAALGSIPWIGGVIAASASAGLHTGPANRWPRKKDSSENGCRSIRKDSKTCALH